MRNTLNSTMKYQNKLWTKVLLERLVSKNEVIKFAESQAKKSRNKPKVFQSLVTENMLLQLNDANKAEKKLNLTWFRKTLN